MTDNVLKIHVRPEEPLTRDMLASILPIQRVFVDGGRLVFCGPRTEGKLGIPAISVDPSAEPLETITLLMHMPNLAEEARITPGKIAAALRVVDRAAASLGPSPVDADEIQRSRVDERVVDINTTRRMFRALEPWLIDWQ